MASPEKKDHLTHSYSYSTATYTTNDVLTYSMGPGMMGTHTYGHSTYSSVITMLLTISASPLHNFSSTHALPSTSSFEDEIAEDASTIILSATAGTPTTVWSPTRASTPPPSATSATALVIDTIQSPAPTDGEAGIISPATATAESQLHSDAATGQHANTTQARLSTAETAGVVVGGIAGLCFIGFAATLLLMRRREKRRRAREMTMGYGEERYSA